MSCTRWQIEPYKNNNDAEVEPGAEEVAVFHHADVPASSRIHSWLMLTLACMSWNSQSSNQILLDMPLKENNTASTDTGKN